ncbi:MAG: sn-glycerol-3-phosphate ABC transporter ATP-binding protein UgpC [Chloroflexi bacterium]|nr:sn-glycerol-3-phosphate ABC transporter ATP-binding protein UgpC [Chloroflexota bacterium]
MADVTLDRVSKWFRDVRACEELSMQVRDGEFVVLVGPSGSGKSTVLRMVAGLEEITSGDLSIGDRRVNDLPPKDRDIAMVFQSYALYPHMSVYDNLAFGLSLRGTPRTEIDRRVREAAEMLGIGELLGRKPRQLSGGQRQRVAVGRAIVREPQVFLMDEPLSNLDAQLRVQTRAELVKLHQRLGTTVIYVTHDQVEAMTMGQRIAVLRDGLLQQFDTPQQLYNDPANVFTAGFIGSPSMNFFPGVLTRAGDGQIGVRGDGFAVPLSPSVAARVAGLVGEHVILGIRPEHIADPRQITDPGAVRARARVNVVEPLGSEVYVYLETDGTEFVGRLDARYAPRPGDEIEIAIATDRIHLFDPASETSLTRRAAKEPRAPPDPVRSTDG